MVGMDRMAGDEQQAYYQPQQPMAPGTRPLVDPEAMGEVDPNLYPQAKEATHKIRGKSDFIEMLFGSVDQELLTVKTFYFFFYSAFGSLFPLMGVYFKQMGMNAGQCGLLIGSRPFVEFLSAPFWGSLADRWQKGKVLLLASLSAWIIFTVPLGFIQPPATSCLVTEDNGEITFRTPQKPADIYKRDLAHVTTLEDVDFDVTSRSNGPLTRTVRYIKDLHSFQSPIPIGWLTKSETTPEQSGWVIPSWSRIVYRTDDIQKAFFLLLLLVIIGEFFSAPAITLADSAVITLLGEDADRYGHQRMFGSLGWGLAMFFVGIALDHSTAFPEHPCTPTNHEKNYTICFATFSVLMGAALLTATQITFRYDFPSQEQQQQLAAAAAAAAQIDPEKSAQMSREEALQQQLAQQLDLPQLNQPVGAPTTTEVKPNINVGKDYGGSPTLFGVASVINHISEIFAYFFSFKLIKQMGHVKVLCLGLIGNILRFLYISWLTNPWWVLPFEFMQGITHAAVWAACCSYIAHNTAQHLRSSAQGVLQGIHHGLGRGCGAVIGGIFVNYFGSTNTFRGYGITCIFVLAAFIFINFYRKDTGFVSELPATEDPHQVAEETAHLAPHGVPSNPIPRALSSNRLHELAGPDPGYGATYQTSGGNLDIPGGGASNPFLQNGGGGGGGGYNYRLDTITEGQPVDEELIRRNFQAYTEVLAHYEGSKAPPALTSLHTQQPLCPGAEASYDW